MTMPPRDPDYVNRRFSLPSGRERGFDRVLRLGLVGLVLGALVWSVPHWPNAWRWITGREPLYMPEHEPNLGAVDLEAVHRERWTDWIVAAARATPGTPDEELAEARLAMRAAIDADANLSDLFDKLDAIVTSDRLRGAGAQRQAIWLTRAWNQYLDEHGYDFFMQSNVLQEARPLFYAHIYRVVASTPGTVGEEPYRVRAVSRLDRINLRETYLGYASNEDEGAVVVSDRVVEFALDQIWPVLDERGGDRLQQVFAPMVASELRRSLPSEAVALLAETAPVRSEAVAAFAAIREREACSRLWVPRLPMAGYDREQLDRLSGFVGAGRCAGITGDELSRLWKANEVLSQRDDLEEAAERLVAWVARAVAIHELRHVADDAEYRDDPRPCEPCISRDPPLVRSEAAAYVAELAWTDAPAAALYQICHATEGGTGAHARARAVVMEALGGSCRDGVPAQLTESARALETSGFGGSAPIGLADDFPERLPVVAARDREPDR